MIGEKIRILPKNEVNECYHRQKGEIIRIDDWHQMIIAKFDFGEGAFKISDEKKIWRKLSDD